MKDKDTLESAIQTAHTKDLQSIEKELNLNSNTLVQIFKYTKELGLIEEFGKYYDKVWERDVRAYYVVYQMLQKEKTNK